MKLRCSPAMGWSLLEMLLVLGLVAVLGRWSITGWQQYQQALYLHEVSERLLNFLREAQTEASWYNQSYRIQVIQQSSVNWRIVIQPGVKMPCQQSGRYCFIPVHPGITLVEEPAAQQMQFYGQRGGAHGGHFSLNNAAGQVRIVLSAKGRLRRCSVQGSLAGLATC